MRIAGLLLYLGGGMFILLFRIPTAGIALAVVCLSAAWLMYAFAGSWCAGC